MKKDKEIKVKVIFTDGFKERYTKACLETALKRYKDKEVTSVKGA